MNKKIMLRIILTFVFCVSLMSFGTVMAYLTSETQVDNEVEIGNVEIEVQEDFPDPGDVGGGDTFKKVVNLLNTGKCDCYIRMKLLLSNESALPYMSMDYDTENWTEKEDGYWYYKWAVSPGESTTNIISQVTLDKNIPDEMISGMDIFVYCEAWEARGFDTYEKAWESAIRNKMAEVV